MKKKLEAELISIAHRILKLKNKSELIQLQQETQKLYEKLSVLRFLEENFAETKPTIGKVEAEEITEAAFDSETVAPEVETEVQPEAEIASEEKAPEVPEEKTPEIPEEKEPVQPEEIEEPTPQPEPVEEIVEEKEVDEVIAEAEEDIEANEETSIPAEENTEEAASVETEENPKQEEDLFKPVFEWTFDNKGEETTEEETKGPENETPAEEQKSEDKFQSGQIAFDELLGKGYTDPVFVKPEELEREKTSSYEEVKNEVIPITRMGDKVPVFKMNNSEIADKTVSLNDRLSKGITVGLNDRIAFVKNLFGNSDEDYNRVLSQLITFNTFAEAQEFIDNMVKPDYNNWEGKDEYAQRFMEVVEKKFT